MKKRLLALALAGTTAFSVFGMNAFAGVHTYDDEKYNDNYVPVVEMAIGASGVVSFELKDGTPVNFNNADFSTYTDFEEIMDDDVVTGTVYFYDIYGYVTDKDNEVSMEDIEEALGADGNIAQQDAIAAIFGRGTTLAHPAQWDTGYGAVGTLRREITDAFFAMRKGMPALTEYTYDDDTTDANTDPFEFEDLYADIQAVTTEFASSTMVYLMQEYNRLIDEEIVTVKAITTADLADLVIEALEARTEDDFKKTSYYYGWLEKFEGLMEDYEEADTRVEYTDAYNALVAELTGNASNNEKADLTDLKAALVTKIGTYDLYPEKDYRDDDPSTAVIEHTEEYDWYTAVLGLAQAMPTNAKKNYQGSVDVIAAALAEATDALEVTTSPKGSKVLALEEDYAAIEGKVEGDYDDDVWEDYVAIMDYAESVLEGAGKDQTDNAIALVGAITADLKDCKNHAKVKSSLVKALKNAIKDAEDWLDEYDETASAAQILAVNKAAVAADKVLTKHQAADKCALISEVEAAIEGIESALDYADIVLGWSQDADGNWMYATEEGYVESGWYKVKDNWCWFEDGKAVQSSWRKIDGTWYYLNAYCFAARGWAKVDGKWYFFNDGCAMLANTVVDGYTLDASGAWVE